MRSPTQEIREWLARVPSLKTAQLQRAQQNAEDRVRTDLGEAPLQADYLKELRAEPLEPVRLSWWQTMKRFIDPLDYLIVPLLLVMVMVSLSHMLHFAADLAVASYAQAPANFSGGIWLSLTVWTLIHQIGLFGLSELPVLYFYTRHKVDSEQKVETENRKRFRVSISGNVLAALSGVFITLVANVVSLLHNNTDGDIFRTGFLVFVGSVLPLITMFLGHRISEIIRRVLAYNRERDQEYTLDHGKWETEREHKLNEYNVSVFDYYRVYKEPSLHVRYSRFLANAIVEYYKQYMAASTHLGKDEWTPEHELFLAAREMQNITKMDDVESAMAFFGHTAEASNGLN